MSRKQQEAEKPDNTKALSQILQADYPRKRLSVRIEESEGGSTLVVERVISSSLQLKGIAVGEALHRCARALVKAEVPRP